MKKNYFFLGLLIAACSGLFAQNAGFGLQVGVHQSVWYGADVDNIIDDAKLDEFILVGKGLGEYQSGVAGAEVIFADTVFESRVGFHTGIQINSEISEYFWLKHEFVFSTKGFKVSSNKYLMDSTGMFVKENLGKRELRFRSYHVDIMPLSLCGQFKGLQVYVGPYVSVSIAQNWVEVEDGGSPLVSTHQYGDFNYYEKGWADDPVAAAEYTPERELNIIDYGYVAGVEFEFPFGLNFSAFYKQGFASVFETPEGSLKANAFNKTMGLSMGYTFGQD